MRRAGPSSAGRVAGLGSKARRIAAVATLILACIPALRGQSLKEEDFRKLNEYIQNRSYAKYAIVVAEYLGAMGPREVVSPDSMRWRARVNGMPYDPAWDKRPREFWGALLKHIENEIPKMTARLGGESSRLAERPVETSRLAEGPTSLQRDGKGRPIVTDDLIGRYLRAEYSKTQTGGGPWRAGGFTRFDYDDVVKRIEWARSVKRSQGGETLVSTDAMREQFSDEEVRVLNSRWRDLDNAQNGRWNEVNW